MHRSNDDVAGPSADSLSAVFPPISPEEKNPSIVSHFSRLPSLLDKKYGRAKSQEWRRRMASEWEHVCGEEEAELGVAGCTYRLTHLVG